MSNFAPIAIFLFKRPRHTLNMFASLASNPEFSDSPLYIFCDAARTEGEQAVVEETRRIAREWPHANKVVFEQKCNRGLAGSITMGVGELCQKYGRVIVLEDDLVLAPTFLAFMNKALERYQDNAEIMQVSGYMFPVRSDASEHAIFLPLTSTWGWATWSRAWESFGRDEEKHIAALNADRAIRKAFNLNGAYPYFRRLRHQLAGLSDSWGIRWYLAVFFAKGLVLYPPATLVANEGHDGSGTHCRVEGAEDGVSVAPDPVCWVFPEVGQVSGAPYGLVQDYLRRRYGIFPRLLVLFRTKLTIYRQRLFG